MNSFIEADLAVEAAALVVGAGRLGAYVGDLVSLAQAFGGALGPLGGLREGLLHHWLI